MAENIPKIKLTQTEELARVNFIIFRRSRSFTQEFIANEMNVERSFIGNIEAGTKRLNLRHLDQLKTIFGCEVCSFFESNHTKKDKNSG